MCLPACCCRSFGVMCCCTVAVCALRVVCLLCLFLHPVKIIQSFCVVCIRGVRSWLRRVCAVLRSDQPLIRLPVCRVVAGCCPPTGHARVSTACVLCSFDTVVVSAASSHHPAVREFAGMLRKGLVVLLCYLGARQPFACSPGNGDNLFPPQYNNSHGPMQFHTQFNSLPWAESDGTLEPFSPNSCMKPSSCGAHGDMNTLPARCDTTENRLEGSRCHD